MKAEGEDEGSRDRNATLERNGSEKVLAVNGLKTTPHKSGKVSKN